jgi:hypothetical protein
MCAVAARLRLEFFGQKPRQKVLFGLRILGRAPAQRLLARVGAEVIDQSAHGHTQPPGLHVVRGIAQQHRRLDNFCPDLVEVGARLDPADQLVRVGGAAHFAQHPKRLGEPVATALGEDRQLTLLQVGRPIDEPLIERRLREKDAVFHALLRPRGYTSGGRMRVLEAVARIVQLGGANDRAARVAEMRAQFEERTGAFAPEDAWFEERSRAFWCDAVTRVRFGREVEGELTGEERLWLGPLDRAHRGLFRADGDVLVDAWSGAELVVTLVDEESQAELDAATGQLFDGRVVGTDAQPGTGTDAQPGTGTDAQPGTGSTEVIVALLPGAVFHPRHATDAIAPVLKAARERGLSTDDVLDALLRMERTLRSLSRVKAAYAYRPDALTPRSAAVPVRRAVT